jgi:hypothetical protein
MSSEEQFAYKREDRTKFSAERFPLVRGQAVTSGRGESWFFGGVSRGAYGNSSGRVRVYRTCPDAYTASSGAQDCPHMWHRNGIDVQEYFPSVFGLYLGDAEGNEA